MPLRDGCGLTQLAARSRRKLVCPMADVGSVDANWPFTLNSD